MKVIIIERGIGSMFEHYSVSASLGKNHLHYKLNALKEEGYKIIDVAENADIPLPGSAATPYSSTWGRTEKGWRITVERIKRS